MRIVVIGAVAAGMSAASQARRRIPQAEVVVFERGPYVSYGACGMPYNIEDPSREMEDLVVIPPERFRSERNIDVRVHHEVLAIDPQRQQLTVRGPEGVESVEPYDRLIIATGASATKPPLPGFDQPGVFFLRSLADGVALKRQLAERNSRRAVIVGAGYIGLEMAEALRARGLQVTVLERLEQAVPGLDSELARVVAAELARQEVRLETGVAVEAVERDGEELRVRTSGGEFDTDLVLVAVGVRPNVELARSAGIRLGESGAIAVDDRQRTSAPNVFAAGDCAEAPHLVTGRPTWIPLGTTANKQGKVAGANATGADERFSGVVGTAGFKVFDFEVARTGLGPQEVKRLGPDAFAARSRHRSRGHGYPGGSDVHTVIYAETSSGRLLGAQMVGEAVGKRIDVFATALKAGMTIDEVEGLDLAYAPPFAPVYDPVLIAASVAVKAREKRRGTAAA